MFSMRRARLGSDFIDEFVQQSTSSPNNWFLPTGRRSPLLRTVPIDLHPLPAQPPGWTEDRLDRRKRCRRFAGPR